MQPITKEELAAYLDDALGETETARIEKAVRESETLKSELKQLLRERDPSDHSLGAIWRQERLSCPSREMLHSFLLDKLDVLEPAEQDYLDFHLQTINCAYCQANLADLQSQQTEGPAERQARQRRLLGKSHPTG